MKISDILCNKPTTMNVITLQNFMLFIYQFALCRHVHLLTFLLSFWNKTSV
jgi:hypothetical protein